MTDPADILLDELIADAKSGCARIISHLQLLNNPLSKSAHVIVNTADELVVAGNLLVHLLSGMHALRENTQES